MFTAALLCVLDLGCSSLRKVKKEPFVSRIKIWKLREEKVRDAVMKSLEEGWLLRKGKSVESICVEFRDCFLKAAECVCGRMKGWTDDDEVRSALTEKRKAFKLYERAKDSMEGEVEVLKKKYQITKVNAKRIVAKAKDAERERIRNQLDEEYKKGTVFKWQSK